MQLPGGSPWSQLVILEFFMDVALHSADIDDCYYENNSLKV